MKTFILTFVIFNLCQTFGFKCGEVQQATGLIHGGSASTIETWPFAASLHHGDELKFFCGGTVVSHKHILTGATCIQTKYSSEAIDANDVKVSVGQTDLSMITSADLFGVTKMIVHPDWNTTKENYDADIAIIVLSRNLIFSNKVQPACLPKDNSIESITSGYIIGWGRSEDTSKSHEVVLRHVKTNAVNDTTCFLTNHKIATIASYRTFCAGGTASGPCIGDSGSGMFVKVGNYWSLKGITSAAMIDYDGCSKSAFSVFTDVYKFYDFVKTAIGTADLSN